MFPPPVNFHFLFSSRPSKIRLRRFVTKQLLSIPLHTTNYSKHFHLCVEILISPVEWEHFGIQVWILATFASTTKSQLKTIGDQLVLLVYSSYLSSDFSVRSYLLSEGHRYGVWGFIWRGYQESSRDHYVRRSGWYQNMITSLINPLQ